MSAEQPKPQKKRDWLSIIVDVTAASIMIGTAAFIIALFIWVLRIMKVIP